MFCYLILTFLLTTSTSGVTKMVKAKVERVEKPKVKIHRFATKS